MRRVIATWWLGTESWRHSEFDAVVSDVQIGPQHKIRVGLSIVARDTRTKLRRTSNNRIRYHMSPKKRDEVSVSNGIILDRKQRQLAFEQGSRAESAWVVERNPMKRDHVFCNCKDLKKISKNLNHLKQNVFFRHLIHQISGCLHLPYLRSRWKAQMTH